MDTGRRPTLLTIPLSHFCEKARWGLDRTQIAYTEHRHAPVFHLLPVRRAGGRHQTPLLITRQGAVADSTAILLWANDHACEGRTLYPDDPFARNAVLALEDRFDRTFGPSVRTALYFYLLPFPDLIIPLWTYGVPWYERMLSPLIYRPLRRFMRSSMSINATGAGKSVEQVMRTIDDISNVLADGRKYLTGDGFGAADITFAALAAPVVWPPGYAVPLPELDELPVAAATLIRHVRDTPAGAYVFRMYREERC